MALHADLFTNEDVDLVKTGANVNRTTNAAMFFADYSPNGAWEPGAGGRLAAVNPAGAKLDAWYSVRLYLAQSGWDSFGAPNPTTHAPILFVGADGATVVARLRPLAVQGQCQLELFAGGSSWVTVGPAFTITFGIPGRFDFQFRLADSGGRVAWYYQGALVGELTGDTLLSATTGIAQMWVQPTGYAANGGGGGSYAYATEWIVGADGDTRNARVFTKNQTGAGDTNTFSTPGTVADINEATENTGTAISANAAGQLALFAGRAVPAGISGMVVAEYQVSAKARTAGGGPAHMALAVKKGGAVSYRPEVLLPDVYGRIAATFTSATGGPGTLAELTAVQTGAEARA
jgi:hypothetical protein